MPVYKLVKTDVDATYLLWHITESVEDLLKQVSFSVSEQEAWQQITHPRKQQEWLAVRVALKYLLHKSGYAYTGLYKDHLGKPNLLNSSLHISIAHCFPFAVAFLDKKNPVGIDIQLPHKKLHKVKHKFLNDEEIKDSEGDLEKLCIYWCAKEAAYKAYSRKTLSLKQHIKLASFTKSCKGVLWGELASRPLTISYTFHERYVLAWCEKG